MDVLFLELKSKGIFLVWYRSEVTWGSCAYVCVQAHVRFSLSTVYVHLKLSTEWKANSWTGNLLSVFSPFS